jgi:hypothetical protein
MDRSNLTILGPFFSPIIGAIVGSVITFLVTYYIVVRRKYLVFLISKSEDIAFPLRQQGMRVHQFVSIKIGDREFNSLNKSTVRVRNKGNAVINNVVFRLVISGEHTVIPTVIARQLDLRRSIHVSTDPDNSLDPICTISTEYLNPNEAFAIVLFFDGHHNECSIYCRMEDVKIKIRRGGTLLEQILDDRSPTSIWAYLMRLLLAPVLGPGLWMRRFRRFW